MSGLEEERNALLERFRKFLLESPNELLYPGVLFPVLVRLIASAATMQNRSVDECVAIENELLEVLISRNILEYLQ
jgi:hypothetical protein